MDDENSGAAAPTGPLDDRELRVWKALARSLVVIPRTLDGDLRQQSQMTLGDYQVLVMLSEAPDRRSRMSDLASAVGLSASRMTRLVDALRRRGWVGKERDGCDRRGAIAVLTDDGLTALEQAYPAHLASVRRHVMAALDGVDLEALAEALETMAGGPVP
ncbi:MarR family winged helix-turn-helix transcriptional regulator [Williamsia deligens]|uniref:MarR family winged helix-turn-helix transcriptional regulator n=1 Tax=Williamsia deligens TaxID=321325 RepID=A0ABW3G640_9NOCA|nr:MarR family transcriptional regulator [Williamsia deligens]MCP2193713.1 DNA-binding transcriptional regulator, MarR family [Williamsia deligens]